MLFALGYPRMLERGTALFKAYYEAKQSIEGCQKFIRRYPDERELCAGAQIRIAELLARKGENQQAIEAYRKAVREYGQTIVPERNAIFRVEDWALFRIGLLYKEIGQSEKATELFSNLTKEAWDSNTRRAARRQYLLTKQAHLKLSVRVSVPDRETYAVGDEIPVIVVVENATEEMVVFKCYARMWMRTYGATAPRTGSEEIALLPGAKCKRDMRFIRMDTKGLGPGEYKVTGALSGIPFTTNSVTVHIVDRK